MFSWLPLLLACSRPVTTDPAGEPSAPREPTALERARSELHSAERTLLRSEAVARLEAGKVEEAAAPLLAAARIGGFPELEARAIEQADPGLAGQLHAALADAIRTDPARSLAHHQAAVAAAAEAEIRARFADGIEPALPRVAGVHRGMVDPALSLALSRHVAPPERAVLERAGVARLQALARLAELPEGSVDSVDGAIAAGIPEPIAVSEYVEGALTALDTYTRIAWPAELGAWEAHHTGVTVGVGLELDGDVVRLPIPGGPAFEAGVHQGDRLVAVIEGTRRIEGEEAAAALSGPEGTLVGLELDRAGETVAIAMKRAPVQTTTVFGWTRAEDNRWTLPIEGHPDVGYLRIGAFRPYTDEAARTLLEGVDGLRALVLDLRGNGGGDVQAAANLVDLFAGEGIVAKLEGPGAPPPPAPGEVAWNALVPGDPWESLPIAVLVDRDTASAAELVAGALAARPGVVVIGERTYGKGWSQGLELDEAHGFALQTTNAAWHLADGRAIQRIPGASRWGVDPDVVLVESAAESWQNQARRTRLEFPRTHADKSPMLPPDLGGREGLPALDTDPGIERAIEALAPLR